jgi:hypothetical protein
MAEREDRRAHLVATRPCGCLVMILTTEDPDPPTPSGVKKFPPYKAAAKDIAEFYADVHKKQTRKKNPLQLTVFTHTGRPSFPHQCDACAPPKNANVLPGAA